MTEYIFWISVIFIIYTYFGYPLVIWLLSMSRKDVKVDIKKITDWTSVTIVIPVFNDLEKVKIKLNNLREIDYPDNKLKIIFVSDGSDDGTNEFLLHEPDVSLIKYNDRQGKPTALNTALKEVITEVVVFTDVRQEIKSDAIKYLVARLMLPGVGAVSGELCHNESKTNAGKNVGIYWLYEKFIRIAESRFYSTAGVTGALYSIHTKDYSDLRVNTLLDDFEIPMSILAKGKSVVLETQAKLYDILEESIENEKKRKIRTLTGNFQSFGWNFWLFLPWRNPIFFQFLSHKVFRLLVPYAMIGAFISSIIIDEPFYMFLFWAQFVFFSVGALGIVSVRLRVNKVVGIIVLFLELNWTAVLALKQYILGQVYVRWDKS